MEDKLKDFVNKYSDIVTVSMLVDLCNIVGVKPSVVLGSNKAIAGARCILDQHSKSEKKSKIQEESKKFVTKIEFVMPKFLTCDEFAAMYQVKTLTVWSWIRAGKLNAIRTGKEYRIRPEDAQAFNDARYTRRIIM